MEFYLKGIFVHVISIIVEVTHTMIEKGVLYNNKLDV